MSKGITEDILLKAGFKNDGTNCLTLNIPKTIDIYRVYYPMYGRHWKCLIYSEDKIQYLAAAYIQTICHFNKFMELMDINFKLKEE